MGEQPVIEQLRRRKWNWIGEVATRPRRKRTTEKHLEKRSAEVSVDSKLHVRLEEAGDGSTRQSGCRRVGCGK